MPLKNFSGTIIFPFSIKQAVKLMPRLVGLLGTETPDPGMGFHILPCSGVHTFGMKYPVDLLFLDKDEVVVETVIRLRPNKMTRVIASAHSVLELPPGAIAQHQIKIGDRLCVEADEEVRANADALRNLFHWPVNVAIALLWSKFVVTAATDWLHNAGAINLGIIVHNTLIMLLFMTRRKSRETSYRFSDWLIPILTMISTLLLRPDSATHQALDSLSAVMQGIGIAAIVVSLASLGRSFGVIPANRRIKISGAYRLVRHPMYTSELFFYLGFVLGNFSLRNILLVVLILAGQLYRAIAEEKLLSGDPGYRAYREKVRYRLIPGIF